MVRGCRLDDYQLSHSLINLACGLFAASLQVDVLVFLSTGLGVAIALIFDLYLS